MPFSPELLVTKSTQYDYDETNNEMIDDVLRFLREVFPDTSLFDYMTATLSSYLDGKKRHCRFGLG